MAQGLPPIGAEVSTQMSSGLLEPGNVDLYAQPKVKNPDGTISTVDSRSFNFDGKEYLLPSVTPDGRHLKTDDQIVAEFKKTGRHLGVFASPAAATAYAKQLHNDYAAGHYEKPALPPIGAVVGDTSKKEESPSSFMQTAEDLAIGAAKGVGNTVYGLGKLVHDYTPIGRISDAIQPGAFDEKNKPPELTPTNTTQRVGQGVEQVGEFFLPVGAAGKVAKAAEIGKAGLLTMAQGGGPVAGGASAAITAVLPGGGVAKKAAGALEESAAKTMANSLRATKEWAKAESEKLAPEMLKRGIGGSFRSMRDLARGMAEKVGGNLDEAYKAAAAVGEAVPGDIVRGNIQLASDALHVLTPAGKRVAIPGHEAAIAKLDELDKFVETLGPSIPVDKAAALKRTWDEIVSKAGLYGQNKMAPASEKAAAWSYREAANAFRQMLNTNPDIAALNKEASFWIGLRDVMNATKLRKVGQTGGLFQAGATAAGATAGALSGESTQERMTNAALYGLAGRQLTKLLQSPYWMSKVSAPAKQMLADALASNSAGRILSATQRIAASLPAQLTAQ